MIYWITVNYYSSALVGRLIDSIPEEFQPDYRVIIVNNSADDHSIFALKSDHVVILTSPANLGFGKACNLGLDWVYRQNSQAMVWLINPDAYFPEGRNNSDLIQDFVEFPIAHPEVSILGTVIYTPEGRVEFSGGEFNPKTGYIAPKTNLEVFPVSKSYIPTSWVSGCSMVIVLKNFQACPQFDPDYFLYYEDFDFCQRYQQQGHRITITNGFQYSIKPLPLLTPFRG